MRGFSAFLLDEETCRKPTGDWRSFGVEATTPLCNVIAGRCSGVAIGEAGEAAGASFRRLVTSVACGLP